MAPPGKQFIARTLLIHAALLFLVLVVVLSAARAIYVSTRAQEVAHAQDFQEQSATEIARGISEFYEGVWNNMDLLGRFDNRDATTAPSATEPSSASTAPSAASAPNRFGGRSGGGPPGRGNRGAAAAAIEPTPQILRRQLRGRISHVFLYVQGSPTQIPAEDENAADGKKIALAAVPWLDRVTGPAVSNYMSVPDVTGDDAGGFNLICVPELPVRRPPQQPPGSPPRPIQRLLVAVIPANDVGRRFMPVTDPPSTNLRALADATLTTIATSNPGMAGENLLQSADPAVRQLTADFAQSPRENSLFVQQSIEVEGRELGPRLITVEPITIGGNHWCLVVTSSLAEMEAGMNSVFRRVLFWGAFVVISITMIMVSTAAQLIRTRARLEHVQNAMLTRELSQAREIQLKWLPHASTSPHGIDIAAVNQPASHISGDFYNWFELPDGRIVVAIGDVTGHGMSAAFLMATTQLLVRNTIARTGDPGPCLREVNEQLSVQVFHGQFVSLLLLVLDLKNGVMDIADAGHPPPLIDVGGKFETLPVKSQLVLGVEHGVEYPTQRLPLPPDATLVLYTDGVVDAMTRQSQRFTLAGLQKSLASAPRGSRKMIDAILDGVNQHLAGQPLDDDLTLVVIRLQPSAAAIPAPAKIG